MRLGQQEASAVLSAIFCLATSDTSWLQFATLVKYHTSYNSRLHDLVVGVLLSEQILITEQPFYFFRLTEQILSVADVDSLIRCMQCTLFIFFFDRVRLRTGSTDPTGPLPLPI